MDRRHAVAALLVALGLGAVLLPTVAPAEPSPDRVEYVAEPIDGPVDSWETLDHGNLSGTPRETVDAAVAMPADGTEAVRNVTVGETDSLPPLAEYRRPVVAYDVAVDGEWYLLQVTTFDPPVPERAQYLRLGAVVLGAALVVGGVLTLLWGTDW